MVTYLPEADAQAPRVAFAIGKRAGGAVVRNRIRRRLRGALADLARSELGALGAGAWLVSAAPEAATIPAGELRADLRSAVRAARTRADG
jgi:ribonuclease P protein component